MNRVLSATLQLAALLIVTGCASGARPGPAGTTIQVEPTAAGAPSMGDALPPLPVSIIDDGRATDRRIEQIEVVDQDLRLVVRSLAESFGMNYQIDPGVAGVVTTRLQDVTLQQALDAIVLPHGYTYSVQNNILRVVPAQLSTRIFALDYMSLSRFGSGTTVIQRRLGATGVGLGGAGGFGGVGGVGLGAQGGFGGLGAGGDVIQTVTIADMWAEIRIALEGLIFSGAVPLTTPASPPPGSVTPATPSVAAVSGAQGAGLGGAISSGAGPSAYSRVDGEGRRLIINPMAGTILVAASPEKLAEVEALLSAIEGSVHRQVLIEARIVEVGLNRDFEFGIDWSAIQRLSQVDIQLGAGQSGAELTIRTSADADREIGAVLSAMESQGEVNVLSAPRVSVLNNQRATINVATDEVFFAVTRQPVIGPQGTTIGFETQIVPQQISVGIVLDVHPQIAIDNTITMNVRPVITDVVEVREVRLEDGTQASAPVIDRRETDTVVRVRGGETIVIGGLMRTARTTRRSGIPGLNRIPVIGRIFGGFREETDKRELVIFITPTIVAGQPPLAR